MAPGSGATSRKRQLPASGAHSGAVKLPAIPGVPTESIPRFLEALRLATKFYRRRTAGPYTLRDWEGRHDSEVNHSRASGFRNNDDASAAVFDSIMNRMEAADADAKSTDAREAAMQIEGEMKNAVEAWMDDVKGRALRVANKLTTAAPPPTEGPTSYGHRSVEETETNNTVQRIEEAKERPSIPYALFLYLWEMQQEHDLVVVRRSALFLSGLLLQKSKDCRSHLEQESQLADWVSNMVGQGKIWKDPDKTTVHLPLLQREAFSLLSHLLQSGYGKLYPKIGVASKCLRNQCPNVDVVEVSTLAGMATWRKLRDVALRYGDEEIERVGKLLRRANRYLEALVPRIGGETSGMISAAHEKENRHNRDDDEDDSDIDWEDGDDLDDSQSMHDDAYRAVHISAVEKTMAAMESAGTLLLRGGELEIEFGGPSNAESYANNGSGPDDAAQNPTILKNLEKCIHKLSLRHLPRQTSWLEGLRNADNLAMTSSSLVSMPSKSNKKRLELVERLSELKQQVTNTLSSAARLNLVVTQQRQQQQINASTSRIVAPNMMGESGNVRLGQLLRQKQKKKQARSNRIQIKCQSR